MAIGMLLRSKLFRLLRPKTSSHTEKLYNSKKLTPKILSSIISKRHNNASVVSFHLKPFNQNKAHLAQIQRLSVEYSHEGNYPKSLIVKTMAPVYFFKKVFIGRVAETESAAYNELMRFDDQINNWASIPECYYSHVSWNGQFMFIFEDLTSQGFEPMDSIEGFGQEEEMMVVVEALAKLHARWLGNDVQLKSKFPWIPRFSSNVALQRSVIKLALPFLKVRTTSQSDVPSDVMKLAKLVSNHWDKLLNYLIKHNPQTFLHGDTRLDNVLIRNDDVRFIDWQFCCIGPAILDLIILLSTEIRTLEIENMQEAATLHYYECLKSYNPETTKFYPTYDDFMENYRIALAWVVPLVSLQKLGQMFGADDRDVILREKGIQRMCNMLLHNDCLEVFKERIVQSHTQYFATTNSH